MTLERQKSRRIQNELDKKEKELNDAKIDLQIAKRETNSAECESAKFKEDAKQLREKLKVETNLFVKFFFSKLFLRFRPKTTNCWRCESNGRK